MGIFGASPMPGAWGCDYENPLPKMRTNGGAGSVFFGQGRVRAGVHPMWNPGGGGAAGRLGKENGKMIKIEGARFYCVTCYREFKTLDHFNRRRSTCRPYLRGVDGRKRLTVEKVNGRWEIVKRGGAK
jgi:hypothetical protein